MAWYTDNISVILHIYNARSGHLDPSRLHCSLSPREFAPRRHFDRFSRFCTVHTRDQHAERPHYVKTDTCSTSSAFSLRAIHTTHGYARN